ncbi:MAG: LysR family transcriptional regulator [Actinomycetota bacterium]|nr:LysR family transcriptional regulator [Actinomycetota bacterium]
MLNVERLRALHAVASHGSMQAAADALHVTVSAVSQQVAKLEREVGQPLVERHGRGVRLTEAARLLVDRAGEILALLERAEGELDQLGGEVTGVVRLGAFPTAARGLCPGLVVELAGRHPDLDVRVVEAEPVDSVPMLTRGDLDIVVLQDWYNAPLVLPEVLERLPLFDDVVELALPTGHPMADHAPVRLDDLADERWVSWPGGSICGDWLTHTMRTLGHEPTIVHTAAEHATQLALVAAGLGPAVMPHLGLDHVPAGVRLVPVEPTLTRHLFAAWRTDTARRSAIAAVATALSDLAAARRAETGDDASTPFSHALTTAGGW